MIQIVFNDISAAELSHLPTQVQFHLLEALNIQPADIEEAILAKRYGVLERGGKKLYRCRAGDHRIYFCLLYTSLAPFDRPGELDGAAEEQEFFGQCGLACVRVRNDGKRSPLRDIAQDLGWEPAFARRVARRGAHRKAFGGRKTKAAGREDES